LTEVPNTHRNIRNIQDDVKEALIIIDEQVKSSP
jgi:hypothetical protein